MAKIYCSQVKCPENSFSLTSQKIWDIYKFYMYLACVVIFYNEEMSFVCPLSWKPLTPTQNHGMMHIDSKLYVHNLIQLISHHVMIFTHNTLTLSMIIKNALYKSYSPLAVEEATPFSEHSTSEPGS